MGQFQYAQLPQFMRTMPKPDNVFHAAIVNSKISEFCQSAANWCQSSMPTNLNSGHDSREHLGRLLKLASHIFDEIDVWHASVPNHWKEQYNTRGGDRPSDRVQDPWTTAFLAVSHSTQMTFYLHALAVCDVLGPVNLTRHLEFLNRSPTDFVNVARGRISWLADVICLTVSATVGRLGTDGDFQPRQAASISTVNTLLWPMWAVANCPYATAAQRSLCGLSLRHTGTIMGHRLASMLGKSISHHAPNSLSTLLWKGWPGSCYLNPGR